MSPHLGKTDWTDEELSALRAQVLELLETAGLTRRQAALDAGIAEGTFGPWLNGVYPGDNAKIATQVTLWLKTREDRKAAAAVAVKAPDFQELPTARKYLTALEHAQFVGDMVLIAGGPGTGKTAAAKQHAATRSRVTIATMAPSTRGVANCLQEVMAALGEPEAKGTPQALSRRIAQRFREAGALLIIDEAQHLSQQAVEELRSIHDRTGVGLALVGDENLLTLFSGAAGRGYAQLSSRIGYRARQARPTTADVEQLATAWHITDRDAVKLCRDIAAKPGALRGLTKVLLVASRMAANAQPTAAHIREAWQHQAPDLAA